MIATEEWMDIFQLKEMGNTISAISRKTGLDRKTIRKYLLQGRSKIPILKARKNQESKLAPYEPDILKYLTDIEKYWPPCTTIYEQLEKKGYTGSLSLLQKWIKQYREQHLARVVVRFETPPGKQAQVDWGEQKIKDAQSGVVRKVYIFCMTLGYSRMRFVYFFPKADMYHFLLGHKLAFDYFGGVPQEILYDQNRCVVLKPAVRDAQLNAKFLDFALHYGFTPRVCRPYRPQTKGKVENLVKYVKKDFLSIQDTYDLKIINERGRGWSKKVNSRVHSTTQKIPLSQLKEEHLSAIKTKGDYELYYLETRKVFNDSTFSYRNRRFSVPPIYIGKMVTVKQKPLQERLDVYYQAKLITQHRTDTGDIYVVKRGHRWGVWKIWRNDKKLFYQQYQKEKSKERETENHPLAVYEQVSQMEASRETCYA